MSKGNRPTSIKAPKRLLVTYETSDVQRLLHRAFFGVEHLAQEKDAVAMSFQQFLITANLAVKRIGFNRDPLFVEENVYLMKAHAIGALKPLSDAEKALGYWLSQGTSLMPTNRYGRLPIYVASVYGDLPLGTLEQEARAKALSAMDTLLKQWREYRDLPGVFSEGEIKRLEKLRKECWGHLQDMADPRGPWGKCLLQRRFIPVVGEEHSTMSRLLDGEQESDGLKRQGLMTFLVLCAMPNRLERDYHHSNPLHPSLKATMKHLESECGGRNAALRLAALATELVKDSEAMAEVTAHVESLTWEQLLRLSSLSEEYNLEWAVAAMEWEQERAES